MTRHLAHVETDPESLRRGGSTRTAVCLCGWRGPERASLEMVVDDALAHERSTIVDLAEASPRVEIPLAEALSQLADECGRDDARATAAPWTWSDEIFLWSVETDVGVLEHGGTRWPVSPDNREVIAAGRNRLPELARVLRAAARRVDLLEELAIQGAMARDRLRTRIDQLESKLAAAIARKATLP